MKLAHYGEDRLVAELTRALATDASVRTGIGDDCAVIGGRRDKTWQLLKTDCVVEGIHFLPDAAPRRIGWKALARAISDIAAMGGRALAVVDALWAAEEDTAGQLLAGMRAACERYGVPLVHIEGDFKKPLRHGDAVGLELVCEAVGARSYTCRVDLVPEGAAAPAASLRFTAAVIDMHNFQSVDVPVRSVSAGSASGGAFRRDIFYVF